MIKTLTRLNKQIFTFKPFLFLFNIFIWSIILIMPLINAFFVSKIFSSLEAENIGTFKLIFAILLAVVTVHLALIFLGGLIDTLFRYYCKTIIQFNIVKNLISKKNTFDYNETINIIEHDCENLKELLSLQIDCLSNIIFYMIGITILLKVNVFLSILIIATTFLFSNLAIVKGNILKAKTSCARQASIASTKALEKMLNNASAIRYLDKKHKYLDMLEERYSQEAKLELKKMLYNNLLNSLSDISFNASTLIVFIFSIYSLKNNVYNFQDIILFITYFSYGFSKIDNFIEFNNLMKINNVSISNISTVTDPSMLNNLTYGTLLNDSKPKDIDYKLQIGEYEFSPGNLYQLKLGVNIIENLYELDSAVGIAKPDFGFLIDTIEHNIVFEEQTNDTKLKNVLDIVNLTHELSGRNIHTEILTESADTLSEGQKQRLGIARALYNSNKVIVMHSEVLDFVDIANRDRIILGCMENKYIVIIASN